VIGALTTGHARSERSMRRRRAAKIAVAIVFAVVWVPIAIVMIVRGVSDRRG
jgi:hypothetical protein